MRYMITTSTDVNTGTTFLGEAELRAAVEAWLADPGRVSFYIEVRG